MYRGLLRTARQCAFSLHQTGALPPKCDHAALPVFRLGRSVGINPFNTSSTSYCENKENAPAPPQLKDKEDAQKDSASLAAPTDQAKVEMTAECEGNNLPDNAPPPPQAKDKEDAHKDSDSLATPTDQVQVEMAAECEGTNLPEQGETLLKTPLKTEEGNQQKTEERQPRVKTGKESLLDLLVAMKVDVTTSKKRSKGTKIPARHEPTVTPKPAAMESTHSMFQKATVEASIQSDAQPSVASLSPELVAAASAAAASLPDPSRAESELLQQLRQHEAEPEDHKRGEANNIGNIIADMKVGRPTPRQHTRSSNTIHFDEDGRGYKKSLFERKRLGIFNPATDEESTDAAIAGPNLWDTEFANLLVRTANHMPRNGFEEMIEWTRDGRLWQYPIDNEIGLEEEAAVAFHEHIFLDRHLEEGFPRQGPVRHFMELVVAGLSRNHHLSVRQKTEHIDWYRTYFQEKEDVLKEAAAFLN
ncbi:28S ribosomal protein S31, mitochondrial [Gadus chalcogrammus]|uniref:28S ribosomal protein S31, mitochondrial n=1 Tax=Gadus chalcogrammus TaxID=1042646 RepID=UPI0024C2A269|nr:28S ribosomal protein S31, mitochondrial [Gadus chalcogrammus]